VSTIRAGSSARTEHRPPKSSVNIDWSGYREFLNGKYNQRYVVANYNYTQKYFECYLNPSKILSLPTSIRANVLKALIAFSKFQGNYLGFKETLKEHGIKWLRPDNLTAFLRILNNRSNTNNNVLKWVNDAKPILRNNENLLLKFLLKTGVRKEEGITSFNLIVQLTRENKLNEYYDPSLNCLCHFKYPKLFIRRTKNVFLSFVSENLINEISNSNPVTYSAIRLRLERKGLHMRINELRDYYGTLLLNKGILEVEVNLLQGRIPISIFVKHYWSPKLSELRDRVFKVLETLPL
jgi:hypothetical protein